MQGSPVRPGMVAPPPAAPYGGARSSRASKSTFGVHPLASHNASPTFTPSAHSPTSFLPPLTPTDVVQLHALPSAVAAVPHPHAHSSASQPPPRLSPYLAMHSQQAHLQPAPLSYALQQQHQQYSLAQRQRPNEGDFELGERDTLLQAPSDDRHAAFSDGDDLASPTQQSQQQGLHHPGSSGRYFFSPLAPTLAAVSNAAAAILPQHALPHASNSSPHKQLSADQAGAHKKDDSLQSAFAQQLSQAQGSSGAPMHMHVPGSAALSTGSVFDSVSGSASKAKDRAFYVRQLDRGAVGGIVSQLKSVTHLVSTRVKRAMSTGSANPLSSSAHAAMPLSSFDRFKQSSVRRWKDVDPGLREKLLFALSSLLGTLFFFIIFECFFRVASLSLSLTSEQVFTLSYVGSYLLSIIYQHMLNRLLIFTSAPYCSSLCHTYFVYSISLVFLTTLGAMLIRVLHASPRFIAMLTLPASGVINFYLLRVCLEGNLSMVDAASSATTVPLSAAQHKQERALLILEKNASPGGGVLLGVGADDATSSMLEEGGGGGSSAALLPLQSPLHMSASPPTPASSGGTASGASATPVGIMGTYASPYGSRRYAASSTKGSSTHSWQHHTYAAAHAGPTG